jgi:hypothetical protein
MPAVCRNPINQNRQGLTGTAQHFPRGRQQNNRGNIGCAVGPPVAPQFGLFVFVLAKINNVPAPALAAIIHKAF